MANSFFQLNYDQLVSIAKKFKDEGEDIAQLHSTTRQRVRDLHKEWIGDAADKFFDEMETELLPAVQRLSQALFLSQDMTNEMMKIIQDADEETVGYFRNQLSGDDFGAGLFGSALQGLQGGSPGADDFGAGKFGEAVGSVPGGGGSSAPEDFGAATFGEALDGDSSNASDQTGASGDSQGGGSGGDSSDKKQKEKETPEMETEPTSAGGGGGSSSSSSQGLQGDLKNMGVGLSNQAPQTASAGGDSVKMPDHVYSGSDSPKPEGSESKPESSKPGVDTGSDDSGQSSAGGSVAAGVAGAAGAAAAGKAAKVVKEQQEDGQ